MTLLRRAIVSGAVAWAAAIPAAAYVVSVSRGAVPLAAAASVYLAGALVCHQRPERSFAIGATTFPVCARCTGIYLGAAIAAAAAALADARGVRPGGVRSPARLARHARAVLAIAMIPTAITLGYEWTAGVAPSNAIRFAAGLPLGAAAAWLVVGWLRGDDQVN